VIVALISSIPLAIDADPVQCILVKTPTLSAFIDSGRCMRRAIEFFAGIGLIRKGLEEAGWRVIFANDIDEKKREIYKKNYGEGEFLCRDIRHLKGSEIPDAELATASFPCTDLSLAGNRNGLAGRQSGTFWEFVRILKEMGARKPPLVLIENVEGFATSNEGKDLGAAVSALNALGYVCDLLVVDAKHFVPQSRPRLFIISSLVSSVSCDDRVSGPIRPDWITAFIAKNPSLRIQLSLIPKLPEPSKSLAEIVGRLKADDPQWWDKNRLANFIRSLSKKNRDKLAALKKSRKFVWATAYRRTRSGVPRWEIRDDNISGCLRTARGGSSKQAVVEAGLGQVRVRWMAALEYARLQGAGDYNLDGIPESQAIFGFGDAVCVPVITWVAENCLNPLIEKRASLANPAKKVNYA
jgi:DNA (cytosine-5)-methyltransferase 1